MLPQHPAGLPAHTRALIPEDKGDVSLQNSEVGVVIMTCKLGALPTKCPNGPMQLMCPPPPLQIPVRDRHPQSDAFPQWALDPGSPHLYKRREAAVLRQGLWVQLHMT